MVHRYAHLSPGQLAAAVEKIVATPVVDSRKRLELRQSFESAARVLGRKERDAEVN